MARRRFYCEEELRLNRRLAPETYHRVVPLCSDEAGRLTLDGSGSAVEWLVEMTRLPQSRMLDITLAQRCVTEPEVRRLGKLLADFYAGCEPEYADGHVYLEHLTREQSINRSVLQNRELGFAGIAMPVLDTADRGLELLRSEIDARIARGCIVEGHGDLRPEHVCLAEPLQIIDCLEFNRSMRLVDPFDEINYLGMECRMLGAQWVRAILLDELAARLPDGPCAALLAFYGTFRALLRARLCLVHLLERPLRHAERWRPLAIRYIAMAKSEASVFHTEKV